MNELDKFSVPVIEVDSAIIDDFYEHKEIILDRYDVPVNSFATFKAGSKSAIAIYGGSYAWRLVKANNATSFQKISPKDLQQTCVFESLKNKMIPLQVIIGSAGSGKTTIACAYALEQNISNKKNIILTKPTSQVGKSKAFAGPVPGDMKEKFAPYLESYLIAFKNVLGANSSYFLEQLQKKEELKFVPIEMIRGCTLDNATIIVDETQNLGWHELYSLITRIGMDSQLIVLGDLSQIDTGQKPEQTGLWKLINSQPFLESNLKSVVVLKKQYRSPIVDLAIKINTWILENE